jgi:membrane protein YfhO
VKTAAAGALLAVAAAIAFWPVVSGDRSFFQLDLRYEHVPIWHAVQQAIRSGESPYWIEGQYCGNPLLFTQEAPPFYPLTVPLLATGAPAHRLADLFTLFHFWLAGFTAFLFLRDRGCDPPSAVFGGLAWMLSARMVQSSIWPNAVAVQSLLPLLLLGLFRVAEGRRRSGVLWSSVAGGVALLASRPQSLLGAAPLLVAGAAAAVWLARRRAAAMRDIATIGLLSAALGAPALLTSAVLYSETSRVIGLTQSQRNVNPLTLGGDLDQVFLPVDGPSRWPEAAAYAGVLVAVLFVAGVALVIRRPDGLSRGLLLALILGGGCGLVFAFGENGPLGLVADLPLLRSFRVPARYLISWSLALALGSGLVLSSLLAKSRRAARLAVLFPAALAIDLVLHARAAVPTAPSVLYSIEPRLAAILRSKFRPDAAGFAPRVWSTVFPPPLWMLDDETKLAFAKNREPLYGALPVRFGLEAIAGGGPSTKRWNLLFRHLSPRVAALGGVGAIVTELDRGEPGKPSQLFVEEFRGLPRAILVSEWIVVPRSRAIAAILDPALDPSRTAVLEEGASGRAKPPWSPGQGSVRIRSREAGRIALHVVAPGDAVLVVFNTFERGWRATVDGKPQPVLAADAAFQGIRLAPGEHVVGLEYKPRGLAAGIAAAALGVLGVVICAFRMPPS